MLHQSPSSDTSSPVEISISREYLSAIPLFSPSAVSRLGTWSDSAPEETYTFHIPQSEISTGSRFFQPSLPVTIRRSPARSTLKIPSKVPPKFSPAGSMNKIFGGTFLDLYHLQQCLNSRRGQIVHQRNQSYHPSSSPSRVSAHFIIKQNIRIFLKMDMF